MEDGELLVVPLAPVLPLMPVPDELLLCAKAVLPRAKSAAETAAPRSFNFIVCAPLKDPIGKGLVLPPGREQWPCPPPCRRAVCKAKHMKTNFHWPTAALGAAIASLSVIAGRLRPRPHGSQTNASQAIDDIELRPSASAEEKIDAGVMGTFPASDPTSIQNPSGDSGRDTPPTRQPPAQPARSAEWMLHPPA